MAAVADATMVKERLREEVIGKPKYNVANYYSETGLWQAIARNKMFDHLVCAVCVFYAVWASVDIDHNRATNLLDSAPVFMTVNIAFAVVFCLEVFIRFMAFKRKKDSCRDAALLVDAVLASLVILDAWVPILRFFQIFARMFRVWRKVPEMLIIFKGLFTACRCVFFCVLLELFFTYLFSLAICTLLRNTPVGEMYFQTVPDSMHSILVHGILFGAHEGILHELNKESPIAEVFFVIFIFLSWITLAVTFGCLCEVVSVVAATEKEAMVISYAKEKMSCVFDNLDVDGSGGISKQDFEQVLMNPESARVIQDLDVDVVGLVDMSDELFSDDDNGQTLTFEQYMELILSLRGSNAVTVKDMVNLRKFMCQTTNDSTDKVEKTVTKPLSDRLGKVEELLNKLLDQKESNAPDPAVEDC